MVPDCGGSTPAVWSVLAAASRMSPRASCDCVDSASPRSIIPLERHPHTELCRPRIVGNNPLEELRGVPVTGRVHEVRVVRQVVDLQEESRLVAADPVDVLEPAVEDDLLFSVDAVTHRHTS